jgi:hypothetical protein
MMKTYFNRYLFIFFIIIGLSYSCIKKNTYTLTPAIEFSDFIPYTDESADLKILFNDGDGDIGVDANDTTLSLFTTYYYYDTVALKYRAFLKTSPNDTLRSNYIVKAPTDAYKGKPISGEISVRLQQYRHSTKIKKIKYVVYLLDKAGNKSNVITTPELNVK